MTYCSTVTVDMARMDGNFLTKTSMFLEKNAKGFHSSSVSVVRTEIDVEISGQTVRLTV